MTRKPFAAWPGYLAAGWVPLPLPAREKFPPPAAWTGGAKKHSGKKPKKGDYKTWEEKGYGVHKAGNIALRMPKSVIGIDVDMYDGKHGRDTLAEYEGRLGKLPGTWTSTAREDGSGIRFFRVPEGLAWASRLGGEASGIEIVRWDHRYAVVWPSVHPSGAQYRWIDPAGAVQDEWVPSLDELSDLPDAWVEDLTSGRREWTEREEAELTHDEVLGWLDGLNDPEGEICLELSGTVARAVAELSADGVAIHEAGLAAAWGVIRDGAHGHSGVRRALREVRDAFFAAATARSRGRLAAARSEWFRLVGDGVRKVAAEIRIKDEDACASLGEFKFNPTRASSVAEEMYGLTDIGNAQRFAALFGEDVRWHEAEGHWLLWGGERWRKDRTGAIESMGKQVAEWIEHSEAAKFDGDDQERFKALKAHARSLGRRGQRVAMLEDAKSLRGMTVVPEQVDADPRLLQCGSRLVRLGEAGAQVRYPLREDYQTLTAGAEFDPDARYPLWDEFLKRVVPAADIRHWLQKAVGYSLFGGNPERKIFFLKGPTSTGKSVFAEALTHALGDYAGVFDMTLFRAQKEQGPNVQLVRLMDKRIIFSSETSEERYLHADQLKRSAGGDTMTARLNRSNDMVTKRPAFTSWIMTNEAPTIRGADRALYQRILCIPFLEEIPEEERRVDLGEKLCSEGAAAILAWAVAGWTAYAEEGLRDVPAEVALHTMKLRGELSEFDVWISEDCSLAGDAWSSTSDLYRAYTIWCEDAGIKDVYSKIHFGRQLANRFEASTKRTGVRAIDHKERGWRGIALRSG